MEVATLVSWSILWEHAAALALVWSAVALAGFALLPILRLRVGLVGVPLIGVVYWTLALYLLPFHGGLDIALAVIAVLAAVHCARLWRHQSWRIRPAASTFLLVLGSLPYLTTLLYHYVPFGMDGS